MLCLENFLHYSTYMHIVSQFRDSLMSQSLILFQHWLKNLIPVRFERLCLFSLAQLDKSEAMIGKGIMEAADSMTLPPQVLYSLFYISLTFSLGSQQMSQAEIENDAATLGQYLWRLTAPELSTGRRNDSESRRLETSQSASITVRCTNIFRSQLPICCVIIALHPILAFLRLLTVKSYIKTLKISCIVYWFIFSKYELVCFQSCRSWGPLLFLFLLKSIGSRPVNNPKFFRCFREVQSLLLNLGCLEHGTVWG